MTDEPLSQMLSDQHHRCDRLIEQFRHDPNPTTSQGLYEAISLLRRHIYAEEQLLFPYLTVGSTVMVTLGMMRGHGQVWPLLDEIQQALDQAQLERLDDALTRLSELLAHHNLVEEAVIYPQADSILTPQQTQTLREFLTNGIMPDQWVCQQAH